MEHLIRLLLLVPGRHELPRATSMYAPDIKKIASSKSRNGGLSRDTLAALIPEKKSAGQEYSPDSTPLNHG